VVEDHATVQPFRRDQREPDTDSLKFAVHSFAGFWADDGFLQLQMQPSNPVDEHPRGVVTHALGISRSIALSLASHQSVIF
jgi:hypothetical protein